MININFKNFVAEVVRKVNY